MNQATYIVTGCTGYVGNVLTKKLMAEGCRVIGLARSEEKAERVFGSNKPEIVYGDVRNQEDLERLFQGEGPFVVIHTAAQISIGEGDEKEVFEVTVNGTKNMVRAALKYNTKQFLHISSTEALPEELKLDEDLRNYIPEPMKARKGYSRAKSAADAVVLNAVKQYDLNASLLLLAGVLGPGDYSNTHMTQVMIDFINGELPASIDGGYNDFDIRDMADVLPAIIANAKKGESYLFANQPDKINEVLGHVAEMTGRKMLKTLPLWTAYVGLPFLYLGSKLTGHRPLYTLSSLKSLGADAAFPIGKAVEEFGYNPRPLKETVQDHVRFLEENGMVTL